MADSHNVYVVEKGNEYLVALPYNGYLRWSVSIYDAARITRYRLARMLADHVEGILVAFNPITGERLRETDVRKGRF